MNRYLGEPRPMGDEEYGAPPWLIEQGADWLNDCTGQRYSKTPLGVTWQDGVDLVRHANRDEGGGYRSAGSVLWAMRTIKLRRWFDKHEDCPPELIAQRPEWASWAAMVEGEERLRAGWTVGDDGEWVAPDRWSDEDDDDLAGRTFASTAAVEDWGDDDLPF